ncbi:hypothetical protein [Hymenobacter edaphi]|uniref:SH3b domain-containing protein n=1 Tax=Hymenobacter edaphi TaxID=2211146 RepID=A0A328BGT4_9BACT|nr:hypothetical protein [Hymenobacter edaphi]RAK65845.1 hypothetical protein DLM85_14095 [Hymenobacter edaphi]
MLPLLALTSPPPARHQPVYPYEAAIIQDADAYTNVRTDANGRAAINATVRAGEVFLYDTEAYIQQREWISVNVPRGRFCPEVQPLGYMHRSRIRPVSSLPACRPPEMVYKCTLVPFRRQAHRIKYGPAPGSPWVETIDGLRPWGVDGTMPRTETSRLQVVVAGQPVAIPASLYRNLYNGSAEFNAYKNGSTYFVVQFNSDGAGSYGLVWVLKPTGLVQRVLTDDC